jgi:putative GTP pyrophosphokinase
MASDHDCSESPLTYEAATSGLEELGVLVCDMIKRFAVTESLEVHSVTYRVKAKDSSLKKLVRKPDNYKQVQDLTDLLGIRIITYFADEVDRVAEILTAEFKVDTKNSVDRRIITDPERFGYTSLHYVLSLSEARTQFREYRRFATKTFEVQIRSILQNAWAEIEHDLGYKSKNTVPRQIRRRFSRLAGLLELADDEFNALRKELIAYDSEVKQTSEEGLLDLEINGPTIQAYLQKSEIARELDIAIAANFPGPPQLSASTDLYDADAVNTLVKLNIKTVGQLDAFLLKEKSTILAFAHRWLTRPGGMDETDTDDIDPGIFLFYFWFILLLTRMSENERIEVLEKVWPGEGRQTNDELVTAWSNEITMLGCRTK